MKIFGCNFHWTRVYRNLKRLEFSVAYRKDSKVKELVRELLALPFAPYQEIPGLFKRLRDQSVQLVADLNELNEKRANHLIELLFKETRMNMINKGLFLHGKDVRSQNKVYMGTNDRIKDIWKKYQHTKDYTLDELLKYCSKTFRMPCEYDHSD